VSPIVLERPPHRAVERPPHRAVGERRPGGRGRGLTLEQRLGSVLAAAESGHQPDCPVCRGGMVLVDGEALCGDCGSRLA
jgi:hypothetical protein